MDILSPTRSVYVGSLSFYAVAFVFAKFSEAVNRFDQTCIDSLLGEGTVND